MEHLAPELKVLILTKSAEDFGSLYSLIRISRLMYGVFVCGKSSILSAILRHALPLKALREAYIAESIGRMESYASKTVYEARSYKKNYRTPIHLRQHRNLTIPFTCMLEFLTSDLYLQYMQTQDNLATATLPLLPDEEALIYRIFYRATYLPYVIRAGKRDWTGWRERWALRESQPVGNDEVERELSIITKFCEIRERSAVGSRTLLSGSEERQETASVTT